MHEKVRIDIDPDHQPGSLVHQRLATKAIRIGLS
jgi:hypothetical protein